MPRAIGADLWRVGRDFNVSGDQQQWGWAGRGRRYSGLAYPALRGANQLINAAGVLAALESLRQRLPVTAQAVRNGLAHGRAAGPLPDRPGPADAGARRRAQPARGRGAGRNLDAMGFYPTTHAVFGVMADKDLAPMLARMGPLVDRWYFTDLPTRARRAAPTICCAPGRAQNDAHRCRPAARTPTPAEALQAAMAAADPTDRIVVFGSFFTVGGVLAARNAPSCRPARRLSTCRPDSPAPLNLRCTPASNPWRFQVPRSGPQGDAGASTAPTRKQSRRCAAAPAIA